MSEDHMIPETSVEEQSSRVGWFASGFLVAAVMIGLLLFTDGFFGGNDTEAMADTPEKIIEAK